MIASSLQLELLSLGYHPGPVNGQFTPATQTALRKSPQTVEDLPAPERGALGPSTATALGKELGGSSDAVQAPRSALTDATLFNEKIDGAYGPATLAGVEVLARRRDNIEVLVRRVGHHGREPRLSAGVAHVVPVPELACEPALLAP